MLLVTRRAVRERPDGDAAAPPNRVPVILLAAIVVLCGATRLALLLSNRASFNGDEAATGIMARDILHGRLTAFFAGQHYGGTLEQYLQAGLYFIFRLPQNPLTLRLVQVALGMVTCWLIHQCAQLMLHSRAKALVAALVYAIGPWFNILQGVTSLGFYSAGVALGVGALYCALRIRDGLPWRVGFGLCCGLALWTSLTAAYLIVPALIWIAPLVLRRIVPVAAAALGFVAGAAPVWYLITVRHELPVPDAPVTGPPIIDRLSGLGTRMLREFLGVGYWEGHGGLPHVLQELVIAALVVAFAVAAWRHRRRLRAMVTLQVEGRAPVDLLLIAPFVVAGLYITSPNTVLTATPRYLFSAYPLLCITIAALLPRPRRRPIAFGIAAAAVGTLVAVLCASFFVQTRQRLTVAASESMLRQVISTLTTRGERAVYADYWTAMPLQYYAGDRLAASSCIGTKRFPRYDRQVAQAADPVYVSAHSDTTIAAALRKNGIRFRTTRIGVYDIYDQLTPNIRIKI